MTGGGGIERLTRRMLAEARGLDVPSLPDPDLAPVSRVDLARAAGIEPDDWQRRVLESEARKLMLNCCRQSGKSTTAALVAVHEAVYTPGALILMLAPSMRQSGELFRTCLRLMKQIEAPLPAILAESALRLELENGSRIIALPGSESTTRGYGAASTVILDEAARVPDALVAAVRPSLATTNGRLIALSTPAGRRGFFFLEWTNGEGWERSSVVASDVSRISPAFLADELRLLGPRRFEEEYCGVFHDADSAVFASELIERALSAEVQPLWGVA